MPEIPRTRDVHILYKGRTTTLAITPDMITDGWPGCQGVMWDDSPYDEFRVDYCDGVRGAGFALWGSNEDSDVLTGMTEQQPSYGYVVVGSGGWILMTRTFETLTLASGRTVPIVYTEKEPLLWSLRGLLTNEDEWTVAADPRAPNGNYVGWVVQAPNAQTNGYMTVHFAL